MERRSRSLEALDSLKYIDTLDSDLKVKLLLDWSSKYLNNTPIEEYDLELDDLKKLSELFFKNISFLKNYSTSMKLEINSKHKIKKFLK